MPPACAAQAGYARITKDNFFFDGRCLEAENSGLKHPIAMRTVLRHEICLAIFDGLGGENFGEYAAFAAADCMQNTTRKLKDYFDQLANATSGIVCSGDWIGSDVDMLIQANQKNGKKYKKLVEDMDEMGKTLDAYVVYMQQTDEEQAALIRAIGG